MPIEMNDYGYIVTSVCMCAFIFLSVHAVKLEPFECARHSGGKNFAKECLMMYHGILLN